VGEIGTARAQPGHRMEHDLLGELTVPGDAYYGRCLTGITASEAELRETAANTAGLATALSPYLGHAAAGELTREAQASNRPARELVQERGLLSPEVIDALLADPRRLTGTAGLRDATATRQPAGPPTTITGGTA
jgi:aspartate ammonia-lyase